jgi:hypothetical protein
LIETLGYDQRPATRDELEAMGRAVVSGINRNHAEARAARIPDRAEIVRLIEESYRRQTELPGANSATYGPPKPVYLSPALSRLGITGIYFPFTGEPNYNREAPDFSLPFTMAHEMAHQRGYARESEANFIAYLICVNSAHPFVRYSGYRHGLGIVAELWKLAPDEARQVYRQIGPGPRADLEAEYRFWSRYQGRAQALSYNLNNAYLKANRIRSGTRNYNEAVALMIGYYLKHPPPVSTSAGQRDPS